eukprot:7168813-Ditylum_brightwellii.AAC.1
MRLSNNWEQHFTSLEATEDGNCNISVFSLALEWSKAEMERTKSITEEVDTITPRDQDGLSNGSVVRKCYL